MIEGNAQKYFKKPLPSENNQGQVRCSRITRYRSTKTNQTHAQTQPQIQRSKIHKAHTDTQNPYTHITQAHNKHNTHTQNIKNTNKHKTHTQISHIKITHTHTLHDTITQQTTHTHQMHTSLTQTHTTKEKHENAQIHSPKTNTLHTQYTH